MGDSSRHALLGLFHKGLKNDHEGVYRYLASISGTVNLACDLRYIHTFHRYKRRQACAHNTPLETFVCMHDRRRRSSLAERNLNKYIVQAKLRSDSVMRPCASGLL